MKRISTTWSRANHPRRVVGYHPKLERLEDRLQPSSIFTGGLGDTVPDSGLPDSDASALRSDDFGDLSWLATHRRLRTSAPSVSMESLPADSASLHVAGAAGATSSSSSNLGRPQATFLAGAPVASALPVPPVAAGGTASSVSAPPGMAALPLSGRTLPTPTAMLAPNGALHLVPGPTFSGGGRTPGIIWSSLNGSGTADYNYATRFDPVLGVLLTGGSSLALGPYSGAINLFDPSGAGLLGTTYLTGGGGLGIAGLDVAADGGVFVAGSTSAFGSASSAYVAKLDPTLSHVIWALGFGESSSGLGNGFNSVYWKPDGMGGGFVYATGRIDLSGSGGFSNNVFTVKLHDTITPFGDFVVTDWAVPLESTAPTEGYGVVVNSSGVAVAAAFNTFSDSKPILLLLKHSSGALKEGWVFSGAVLGYALSVDKSPVDDTLTFAGNWFDHSGMPCNSMFLTKWDPGLTSPMFTDVYPVGAFNHGDPSYDCEAYATSVKVDSHGEPYVAGIIDGMTTYTDVLVAKFTPALTPLGDSHYGGTHYAVGRGLDLDPTSGVPPAAFVTGFTNAPDFPTTDGSTYSGGMMDGFASKVTVP